MRIRDFEVRLREEFRRDYSQGRNDSSSFLMWFMEKIFGLDRIQAIDSVCDNNNDKGIDGIYVDDQEEEIFVFQSKCKQNNGTEFGDKLLRDFAGVQHWFADRNSVDNLLKATINLELKNLLNSMGVKDKIDTYDVQYHFVINSKKDHNAIEYEDNADNFIVWDIENMFKSYQYISEEPLVQDTIVFSDIDRSNIIEINNVGDDSSVVIFKINAHDILRFKGIADYSLFNKNVRYGLGYTRVNKSISATLQNDEEKDKFILFHNGISVVCESIIVDNDRITLENYSIVNGAQSTLAFYKNSRFIDDNTNILIKVMNIGEDPNLINKITYYNNNQNSINMRDLRSNDNVQRRLEREFEELETMFAMKYIYVPKKGKLVPRDFKSLESDYVAQLITACYLEHPYNTHQKTAMFTSNYNLIFNRNINSKIIILYYLAHETLIDNLNEFQNQTIANYGLFQFFVISLIFEIINEYDESKVIFLNIDNYMNNTDKLIAFYKRLYEALYNLIDQHIIDEQKSENYDYKNFFKTKGTVDPFKAKVKTMFKTVLRMTQTDFSDICVDL